MTRRAEMAALVLAVQRIEGKVDIAVERFANKSEEHGHRIGGLADAERSIETRLHETELENARQRAQLDGLRRDAQEARTIADSKGNRGVAQLSVVIAGCSALFTVAAAIYGR